MLYTYTTRAETIAKGIFFITHSFTNYYSGKIAYRYFADQPGLAQLACFMLLANEGVRYFEQLLFNDQFIELLLALSVYFMSCKSRPVVAGLMLSCAISLKAGGMLLIPGMLGAIHYNYGTITLIVSLFVMLLW